MSENSLNRKRVKKDSVRVTSDPIKPKKRVKIRSETVNEKLPDSVYKSEEGTGKAYDPELLGEEIVCEIEDLKQEDVFRQQFDYELCPKLLEALSDKSGWSRTSLTWNALGSLSVHRPLLTGSSPTSASVKSSPTRLFVDDTTRFASTRAIRPVDASFSLETLHVRPQIVNKLNSASQTFNNGPITELQKELFSIISNYQDLYYTERTFSNSEEIRLVYCTHAVNHALKTRLRIVRNNSKLAAADGNQSVECRDHGLVRPKVLILVPFRHSALRIVKMMMAVLVGEGGNTENKKRFLKSFSGETLRMPKRNPKPPDYEQTFYGNTDDNFKIGIALSKKSLKLYVDFYSSDIIVASPLSLRILIGAPGEIERNYDFLSSVELLIVDQADVLMMQNWEHVDEVVRHMHMVPKDSHGTDLTRVRLSALNGLSKYHTQTLVFSSHPLPQISAFFNVYSRNFAGRVVVANPVRTGSISQIILPVPQIFHKIHVESVTSALEKRFEEFVSELLPRLKSPLMKHTLIYVPSYFDFVKLRNHMKKHDVSFVQISEYTEDRKIDRARDLFFHGEVQMLLYSERFHFFRRIRLKGIRHIVFYQPPTFPHFYPEIVNFIQERRHRNNVTAESEMSVTVMYTKYDVTQVAAILGTDRATRILASDKQLHMIMTQDTPLS